MHTTINYSNSQTPSFDAIEDIKDWFGQKKWDELSPMMAKVIDQEQFELYANLGGVQGFPVKAWYELYHGQGSWRD